MIRTLAAALATSTCIVALATPAAAQTREYNIPAGSLKTALDAYVRQSGRQVVYRADQVRSARSPGVRGSLSPEAALAALLSGSGFTTRTDGKLIAIVQEGNASTATASAAALEGNDATVGQEIIVTGTHIRGVTNPTTNLVILDEKAIEASGYSTPTRIVESMPQNFAQTNQSGVLVPGVTANNTQAAGINLRGAGQGTTLVLLNGHRLPLGFSGIQADISTLPLTAIDRVEVLLDGGSALYGSDAIGGVVNFVLRQDFDGAETRMRAGIAPNGVKEYRLSQAFGGSWQTGNALGGVEYYHRDLLRTSDRIFVPSSTVIGSLLPEDNNYSGFVSLRQELAPWIKVSAETFATRRNSFTLGNVNTRNSTSGQTDEILSSISADVDISSSWTLSTTANYGFNKVNTISRANNTISDYRARANFESYSGIATINGTLFRINENPVRIALGAEYRDESFMGYSKFDSLPAPSFNYRFEQNILSGFAEVNVPLAEPENGIRGLHRLTLTGAARFDRYSNFGSKLSPSFGVAWEPIEALKLRSSVSWAGSHARSSDRSCSRACAGLG